MVNQDNPIAARCGYTITDAVEKRTTLLLVRLRHLLQSSRHQTLLAEECAVIGFTGAPSQPKWLELLFLLRVNSNYAHTRMGLKSHANGSSPLKWTDKLIFCK